MTDLQMKSQLLTSTTAAAQQHLLGALLCVDGKTVADTLPLEGDKAERLLLAIHTMAAHYEAGGLPPKVFFFRYERAQLMVFFSRRSLLLLLLHPEAALAELEVAARKVVTTAHLRTPLPVENAVVQALGLHAAATGAVAEEEPATLPPLSIPTLPTIMTWNEAALSLENLIAKVLSQAQAARLISAAMQRRGIDSSSLCEASVLSEIGTEITAKIPSKPIRASMEREVAELAARLR
jgi:hypothetical protein